MKQIELSTGTLLVVTLPKDAIKIKAHDESSCVWYMMPYTRGWLSRELPSSGFQLLGHPSEITGEVWGKVVERQFDTYLDYQELEDEDIGNLSNFYFSDPAVSGLSICAAHGIKETDVLLFKSKS